MQYRAFALLVAVLASAGCSNRAPTPEPTPTPGTGFLVHRGTQMSLGAAMKEISFKPFLPSRTLLDIAAIPSFISGDTRANHGVAFEYQANRYTFVLSEWPHHGRPITGETPLGSVNGCALSSYGLGTKPHHEGVTWAGPKIIATLQPSGDASVGATRAEARRLVRRGACR